jgi:hypothetical protein
MDSPLNLLEQKSRRLNGAHSAAFLRLRTRRLITRRSVQCEVLKELKREIQTKGKMTEGPDIE